MKRYDAFALTEYKDKQTEEKKTRWTRVGVAFVNDDGSINVNLDAVPLSGRLQLRIPDDKEKERGGGAGGGRSGGKDQGRGRGRGDDDIPF